MPAKKTLQDVKNTLEQLSHGETKLLSTEYQGNKSLLQFQCKCGNIFERNYEHLLRGRYLCKACMLKLKSEHNRSDFHLIKQRIHDMGCEYVSGEYINNNSKLLLRCSCGKLFEKSMSKFFYGQNRCPQCGMKNLAKQKTKYNLEDFSSFLAERGYTLLEKEYKGYHRKHLCLCPNGHHCYAVLEWMIQGQGACKICAINERKGEKSHLYVDGSSTMSDLLRGPLEAWRREVRSLYHDTCPITGLHDQDCDVHHIIPVKMLFDDVCNKYGKQMHLKDTIHNFDSYDQFDKIRNDFLKLHTPDIGILLSKKIHQQFHSLYLHKKYGVKEFEEFLKDYYNINLYDILIIQNQNAILLSS